MAMKSHIRSTVLLVILIVGYIHIVQLIVYYSNYFDRITARHFGRNEDNQTRTAIEVGTSNEQRQGQQDQEQTSSHTSSSSPPSSPPSSSSCQRYCPQKINKIVFTDKPTGISDRKGILHGLAQLSAYLCAQLVVPPPNELLTINHNKKKPISPDMKWSDIYNLTYVQDGSNALVHTISMTSSGPTKFTPSGLVVPPNWLHVISTNGVMKQDFETIQKFSFLQQSSSSQLGVSTQDNNIDTQIGFIWEIHGNWYRSDLWSSPTMRLPSIIFGDTTVGIYTETTTATTTTTTTAPRNYTSYYDERMKPFLNMFHIKNKAKKQNNTHNNDEQDSCRYVHEDTKSLVLMKMQNQLVDEIRRNAPHNSIFGGLHLRRGDAIGKCDTQVETMREFLSCSLNHTETMHRNITFLMMSDETDDEYRKSIVSLSNDYNHVSILDIDLMTERIVRYAIQDGSVDKALDNNYFMYEVTKGVCKNMNDMIDFFIARRRVSKCMACIPLHKQLQKKYDVSV